MSVLVSWDRALSFVFERAPSGAIELVVWAVSPDAEPPVEILRHPPLDFLACAELLAAREPVELGEKPLREDLFALLAFHVCAYKNNLLGFHKLQGDAEMAFVAHAFEAGYDEFHSMEIATVLLVLDDDDLAAVARDVDAELAAGGEWVAEATQLRDYLRTLQLVL
jgi:hypothetical protein